MTSTRAAVRAELLERPSDESSTAQIRLRLGSAGLQPREVEQVSDETVEPVGLREDRREELGSVGVVEREVGRASAPAEVEIAISGVRRS